jgi:hypothetical protein
MMNEEVHSLNDRDSTIVRVGGLSLIVGAVAFIAVFSFLAARFNYPEVLDGRAADVLPALLATGSVGRAVWALYALLPLFWIPGAVGAFHALRPQSEGPMRAAVLLATVSSIAMILGLIRWPSFHWELANAWAAAEPSARPTLDVIFNATNSYLGNFIGEFLGELTVNAFFVLSAIAMLKRQSGFPQWIGYLGAAAGVAGFVGMFRNASAVVAPVAEMNNYLLPLWMIVFGVGLLRYARKPAVVFVPVPTVA